MSYGYHGEIPSFARRAPTMEATSSSTSASSGSSHNHQSALTTIPSATSSNTSSTDSCVQTTSRDFASHAKRCDRCCDPLSTFLEKKDLCPRGGHLAKLVTTAIFDEAIEADGAKKRGEHGGKHSSSKKKRGGDGYGWQRLDVDIPKGCEVVRNLLVAIDRGLQLPVATATSPSDKPSNSSNSPDYRRVVHRENLEQRSRDDASTDSGYSTGSGSYSSDLGRRSQFAMDMERRKKRESTNIPRPALKKPVDDEYIHPDYHSGHSGTPVSPRVGKNATVGFNIEGHYYVPGYDISSTPPPSLRDTDRSTVNARPTPLKSALKKSSSNDHIRESTNIPRSALKKSVDDEYTPSDDNRGPAGTPVSPRNSKNTTVGFNVEGHYYVPGYDISPTPPPSLRDADRSTGNARPTPVRHALAERSALKKSSSNDHTRSDNHRGQATAPGHPALARTPRWVLTSRAITASQATIPSPPPPPSIAKCNDQVKELPSVPESSHITVPPEEKGVRDTTKYMAPGTADSSGDNREPIPGPAPAWQIQKDGTKFQSDLPENQQAGPAEESARQRRISNSGGDDALLQYGKSSGEGKLDEVGHLGLANFIKWSQTPVKLPMNVPIEDTHPPIFGSVSSLDPPGGPLINDAEATADSTADGTATTSKLQQARHDLKEGMLFKKDTRGTGAPWTDEPGYVEEEETEMGASSHQRMAYENVTGLFGGLNSAVPALVEPERIDNLAAAAELQQIKAVDSSEPSQVCERSPAVISSNNSEPRDDTVADDSIASHVTCTGTSSSSMTELDVKQEFVDELLTKNESFHASADLKPDQVESQVEVPEEAQDAAAVDSTGLSPVMIMLASRFTIRQYSNESRMASRANNVKLFLEAHFGRPISFWPLKEPRYNCAKAYTRFYWDCCCGNEMCIDISNTVAEKYADYIANHTQSPAPAGGQTGLSVNPNMHSGSNNGSFPNTGNTINQSGQPNQAPPATPSVSHVSSPPLLPTQQQQNYNKTKIIFWCAKESRYFELMKNIFIKDDSDDMDIFISFKRAYNAIRGFRRYISLTTIVNIKYVRFVRLSHPAPPDCTRGDGYCDNFVEDLPTQNEKDYIAPYCPPHRMPPLGRREFMMHYDSPKRYLNCKYLDEFMPRKITGPLPGTWRIEAWGLQAVEGFAPIKVAAWALAILILSVVSFVPWWLVHHPGDLQNAFVPPLFVSAVLTVWMTLLPGIYNVI